MTVDRKSKEFVEVVEQWRRLRALYRRSGQYAGDWSHKNGVIYYSRRESPIMRCASPDLADYICELHNAFLPWCNAIRLLAIALKQQQLPKNSGKGEASNA